MQLANRLSIVISSRAAKHEAIRMNANATKPPIGIAAYALISSPLPYPRLHRTVIIINVSLVFFGTFTIITY